MKGCRVTLGLAELACDGLGRQGKELAAGLLTGGRSIDEIEKLISRLGRRHSGREAGERADRAGCGCGHTELSQGQ